jgi:hypothetical protein
VYHPKNIISKKFWNKVVKEDTKGKYEIIKDNTEAKYNDGTIEEVLVFGIIMNDCQINQKNITETLFTNASKVIFGIVSVELKIREGKCVAITYSTTEHVKMS